VSIGHVAAEYFLRASLSGALTKGLLDMLSAAFSAVNDALTSVTAILSSIFS
jgi:hypothetical protein